MSDLSSGVKLGCSTRSLLVGCQLFQASVEPTYCVLHPQIEKREEPVVDAEEDGVDCHCKQGLAIYLSYTSNLISSGLRESIRYLAEHKMVWMHVTALLLVPVNNSYHTFVLVCRWTF